MADTPIPTDKKEFRCEHCDGRILIPRDLPATTGPCPHCSQSITSPGPEQPTASVSGISPIPEPSAPAPAPPPVPDIPEAPRKTPTADPVSPVPETDTASESASEPVPAAPAPEPESTSDPKTQGEETPQPKDENPAPVPSPLPSESSPLSKHRANPAASRATSNRPRKKDRAGRKLAGVLIAILLLMLACGAAIFFAINELGLNKSQTGTPNIAPPPPPRAMEENYIRIGWQRDAYQVLAGYMSGTSASAKLPFVLNADKLAAHMEDFYGGGTINDGDTPAEAFSVYELSEEDRSRGLFMMIYDQPPQFDMREFFRPLAPLEVQHGVEEPGLLLSTLARADNFSMNPLRVHAFFKRTPGGLKLDWEIFAQTKYRTFQTFVELPDPGRSQTFRVFIVEDVPDKKHLETGTKTYRVTDPANTSDSARINVKIDSEPGRALSIINWRQSKEKKPVVRTATIELEWTGDAKDPKLQIRRFICWEFLGLGGKDPAAPR